MAALDAAPNVEAALKKEFGVVKPERAEERLERKLNTPTLSILAMESGGGLRVPGRSAIPASAAARLEIRLVNGLVPAEAERARRRAHQEAGLFRRRSTAIRPTRSAARSQCSRASISAAGSPASRVSMESPMAQAVVTALTRNGVPPVRLPTLGGSMPYGTFSDQSEDADRGRLDRELRQQPARP